MTIRSAAPAALALLLASPGAAQPTPDAAEARETLERVCVEDGMDAATCSCLGNFVAGEFSERELVGAALVFSDPQLSADPGVAIGALLERGYSLEEITAVAERVMSLEEAATTTCAVAEAETPEAE